MSSINKNLDHIYYGLVDEEPPARIKPEKVQKEEKKEEKVQNDEPAGTQVKKQKKKKGPKGPTEEEIKHASAFNDMMSAYDKSVQSEKSSKKPVDSTPRRVVIDT